ncbi:3-mercaptopyruvate sulfurtransferase [Perkinsela sp. CCAP 1560/4]|nr:3-mercaptopyruvate sulfurtransferase [Perkinsela sp. CCAP 1560/4]|eukprot:KNH03843.1 3-mercaptopyruvate sulfurtransferase [Perkinsela sp. CCAP 1560/4]
MVFIRKHELFTETQHIRFIDARYYLSDQPRAHTEFLESHLPGAVFADMDAVLSDPTLRGFGRHPLPTPARFLTWLRRNDLYPWRNESLIVCYDNHRGEFASRAWWMLRSLGCSNVRVLYDGFLSWSGAEIAVLLETLQKAQGETNSENSFPHWGVCAEFQVVTYAALPGAKVIDVRSRDRFESTVTAVSPDILPGHYTEAVNLFFGWCDPYETKTKAALESLQPEASRRSIVMCGSGITSCFVIACMAHFGLRLPLLYVGSWSEIEHRTKSARKEE